MLMWTSLLARAHTAAHLHTDVHAYAIRCCTQPNTTSDELAHSLDIPGGWKVTTMHIYQRKLKSTIVFYCV